MSTKLETKRTGNLSINRRDKKEMLKNKREMKKKGGFKRKRNSRDRQRKSNT
jgi:hypothetical protein